MIPGLVSAAVEVDTKSKECTKVHKAPTGTALIVYVGEDRNIIEAIEPSGAAPKFHNENMTDFAGFRFKTGGHERVLAKSVSKKALRHLTRHSGMLLAGIQARAPQGFHVAGFRPEDCRNDVQVPATSESVPAADRYVDANGRKPESRISTVPLNPRFRRGDD